MASAKKAVLFDWRGTLCVTPSDLEWVQTSLRLLGSAATEDAPLLLDRLQSVPGFERLSAPDVDTSARLHRDTYYSVFTEAGFDENFSNALYAVESDVKYNPFALDVRRTLAGIKGAGLRTAIISDIHFDIRPAFASSGMSDLIDLYVLSFEAGVQKPEQAIFNLALKGLQIAPHEALMVGDRASHDGAAVEVGIATLLLPPLSSVEDQRLFHVTDLLAL